jgi:hypothetical protein
MKTNERAFQFEAFYCYARDEKYNAGRGLLCSGLTEAEANTVFGTFVQRGENYALEIRKGSEVIRKHGPSIDEARRSMHAAWKRRQAARKDARAES